MAMSWLSRKEALPAGGRGWRIAEGAPGSPGKSVEGRSQMEPPAMDEDPYGSADPAPLPAGAELGPKVGSAMSLHNGPVVDAVEAVELLSKHLQAEPGRYHWRQNATRDTDSRKVRSSTK